jgi:hypothetical protein
MRTFLQIILLCILAVVVSASVDTLRIGRFSEADLVGWSEKHFKGATEYHIVEDADQKVLQAKSQNAASGLVFEVEYAPQDYPVLSWRWKISSTIAGGDSRTKEGDDYAARIYVVFPHWFFPKTRTLNYIWANRLPKDSFQLSTYTSNAMMIAVESGPGEAGQWLSARRNIVEDYRRAFGELPPDVGVIAIMTDTDNTGETALAWYGDIIASRR